MCAAPLVERRKDRIECSASCGFVNYDNPTPVAAVVVEFEDKIVLAHNRSWSGAFNGLITGFVDHGEGAAECAVREVKEELDLDAAPPTLIGVYPFERMNQIIVGYHVQATGVITLNPETYYVNEVPVSWSFGRFAQLSFLVYLSFTPSILVPWFWIRKMRPASILKSA